MRCTIVHDAPSLLWKIYFVTQIGSQEAVVTPGEDHLVYDRIEPGQSVADKPFLILQDEMYQSLYEAMIGPTPQEDVLKDTRMIRDRLLTMIEHAWEES